MEELIKQWTDEKRYGYLVIRRNKRLSHERIANNASVNHKTSRGFESGSRDYSVDNVYTLIHSLGYDIDVNKRYSQIVEKFNVRFKELGWTYTKVSSLTGVDASTISRTLNNRTRMRLSLYCRFCIALGLDMDDFKELDIVNAYDVLKSTDHYDGPLFDEKYLSIEWGKNDSCKYLDNESVIDGDTIRQSDDYNFVARLATISTPECSKFKFEKFGVFSKKYVEEILGERDISKPLIIQLIHTNNTVDRFGRHLANVWVYIYNEYRLLNYMIAKLGLSTEEYLHKDVNLYHDYFVKAYEYAKDNSMCLYNPNCEDPYWDYHENKGVYSRIGVQVTLNDDSIAYAMPIDYLLTKFEIVDKPFEFEFHVQATRSVRRLVRFDNVKDAKSIKF